MSEVQFANYGRFRDVDATPEEMEMFEILSSVCPDLVLCRKSDSYVTAMLGETDVARFKFTQRAKWIQFPYTAGKLKVSKANDLRNMTKVIKESIEQAEHINSF